MVVRGESMAGVFWTQEQDIGPRARTGHGIAFDGARHRVLLFGGDSLRSRLFGDTWVWDGSNWTQVADTGPSPRAGHRVAFDGARSRSVLFGGSARVLSMGTRGNGTGRTG